MFHESSSVELSRTCRKPNSSENRRLRFCVPPLS